MGELNGIDLAKKCKELCPNMNIIFVTGYLQYSVDAFKLHASGYLMKPAREADLRVEIDNLRHPLISAPVSRVRIQTFGNFEVFVDQKPLGMPIVKCRECLAYLVDRKGARVTATELATVLWEDMPYDKRRQNNTHRVISDTMKYLKDAGVAEVVIKARGEMAIDTEKVDCDYMTNYSWAQSNW